MPLLAEQLSSEAVEQSVAIKWKTHKPKFASAIPPAIGFLNFNC